MAEEKPSMNLNDMFKAKVGKKKGPKPQNLNANSGGAAKVEEKKDKSKKQEDEQWQDDDDVGQTQLKVQALENFKEEQKKDDDASAGQAWKAIRKTEETGVNEKKFPTLATATSANPKGVREVQEQALKTHTNKFAAFGDDDDEATPAKGSKKVAAALVTKAKGERQEDAVKRNEEKLLKEKKAKKRLARDHGDSDSDESKEEEEEAAEEEQGPVRTAASKKKAPAKKTATKDKEPEPQSDGEEMPEDTTIEPDLAAARAKYADRERLPVKELLESELQEERKQKAAAKPAASGRMKKNKFAPFEEDSKSKLMKALPDGW